MLQITIAIESTNATISHQVTAKPPTVKALAKSGEIAVRNDAPDALNGVAWSAARRSRRA